MKTAISIDSIYKSIWNTEILHGISLTVKKWEIFGFIGPNGAWKTTTLKSILGIIEVDSGSIEILWKHPTDIAVKRQIGFMPENTYLYKFLTAEEFLIQSLQFYDEDSSNYHTKVQKVLDRVGLNNARTKKLSTFSKWMLQRIGIAQAIIHNPDIIFLDEPMSGLDPLGRNLVKTLLLELQDEGKTIFLNSHILPDVEAICDSFAIIANGKILKEWSIENIDTSLEEIFLEVISGENVQLQ